MILASRYFVALAMGVSRDNNIKEIPPVGGMGTCFSPLGSLSMSLLAIPP
jgi:hypothetical protein